MIIHNIETLGQLKNSGYKSKTIKEELRNNLISKIKNKETIFKEIHGFDTTVLPEIERAILSGHTINLLGLRGQAKTKIARSLIGLLDEYIPVIKGSEINDDPLAPISIYGKQLLEELGDNTPISWWHREERFFEKLATPDVTIADIIGDIDPIKAAHLKLTYADERVIHYGMIPRANRAIFVINELPDLQARIQVALFNILQEGDVQIRGYKTRLPLDMQFIFTANPEDYTNRGSIVTPLKDRIGSQILTHYPKDTTIGKKITAQEAKLTKEQQEKIYIPDLARTLIEQIAVEARTSDYVDTKSGVSARMTITALENLVSTAHRRMLINNENHTTVRLIDFLGIIPAITGKVELVYEGEQEGANSVALALLNDAIAALYLDYFPAIPKLEKQQEQHDYTAIVDWFFTETGIELSDEATNILYEATLDQIKPLKELVFKYQQEVEAKDLYFFMEFVLWSLVTQKKLSKDRFEKNIQIKDLYGKYISEL